ncbi:MAG TPA: non-canonical purine NTP pyrophosphatase [Candidatus Dormibacteraeota bacterium]|nr:non-canonical purine NTP pyrophosphatase [Candidatus Dormibacteraeota bacterium]
MIGLGPRLPPGTRVVVATRNAGKVAEFRRLLGASGWAVLLLDALPGGSAAAWEEDADTYLANATIKALAVAAATGEVALADDSGVELDAFGGWPGVRSARWLGPDASDADRVQAVRARVAALDAGRRGAVFACALALAAPGPGGQPVLLTTAESRVRGRLLPEPRGTAGFGYDPLFVPEGHATTMAELAPAAKDRLSHRGRAVTALLQQLAPAPGPPR